MSDEAAETDRSTSSDSDEGQSRPRKKTSGEQSSQKRSTTSSAKGSTASRSSQSSSTRSSTSSSGAKSRSRPSSDASSAEGGESERSPRSSLSAVSASKKAIEQFGTLTGRAPESVVGVRRSEEGWNVKLEVVEARRVPDTADLLAEYDIDLDAGGELVSYDRTTRYVRGRPNA